MAVKLIYSEIEADMSSLQDLLLEDHPLVQMRNNYYNSSDN